MAKLPKEISWIARHYRSILIPRPCNRFRIIRFGLARALRAVKSPFEPSNRSSEFSSNLFSPSYILEIVVCCFCGLSATLLGFRIPGCAARRLCHQGKGKDPSYFSAGMIAMTVHTVLRFLFTRIHRFLRFPFEHLSSSIYPYSEFRRIVPSVQNCNCYSSDSSVIGPVWERINRKSIIREIIRERISGRMSVEILVW